MIDPACLGSSQIDGRTLMEVYRQLGDLLLSTGIRFPISFAHAAIYGFEAKLEIRQRGKVSGFISYSNMLGLGRLLITGGLFLDDNSASVLQSNDQFPVTQDQRNTARARVRYQVVPRLWLASGAEYGSGLPVELEASAISDYYGRNTARLYWIT